MASTYKTPGVYVKEISKFPPSVAQVETAIPAFVGYTQTATRKDTDDLLMKPIRITSLLEYETYYGFAEPETAITVAITETQVTVEGEVVRTGISANAALATPSSHIMWYAMRMFFDNGGGPCYIVSVGLFGAIDNLELIAGIDTLETEDEPTLIVVPEAQGLADADQAAGVYQAALQQCTKLQDRFTVMDLWLANDVAINDVEVFRTKIGVNDLKYGSAYYPNLRTTIEYEYADADVNLTHSVVLDGAAGAPGGFDGTTMDTVVGPNGENNDVYALVKTAINVLDVTLPPSSAVVGVYAAVDGNRGVWKAPANVSLATVKDPTIKLTDEEQASLNVHTTGKSINAIRTFKGKGTLIWGARTLAGNDNEWRYVSVRRFFNMVEESVKKASEQFVFEPNDANTWVKVRAMIENFLLLQWRAGALAGAKPEQAFFVKVGLPETMTALDILEGRMNVEIGMAVVRPAEFIILKFSHKMQES